MAKTRVNVSNLNPGMKLAENIANASGITLIPVGVRLTPMFISRLEKWGIEAVDILVEEKEAKEEVANPASLALAAMPNASTEQREFMEAITAEVAQTFANVRDNPLMMQLRAVAIKKLVANGPNGCLAAIRMDPDAAGDRKQ